MTTTNEAWSTGKKFWFYALLATVLIFVVGSFGVSAVNAQGGGACHGTYLVDIPDGNSVGIWTLSNDGTAQVTDSAELAYKFSHQQGAWEVVKGQKAKATFIDIDFDDSNSAPRGYARIDAGFAFGDRCETLAGTLDVWLYESTEDPLDLTTGGILENEDFAFTGRRVNP